MHEIVTKEYCIVEKSEHVLTVRLNRPERLNALHSLAHLELAEVFDDYESDDNMWVAIITGEGRGFCAGNDLRYQAEGGVRHATPKGFAGVTSRWNMTKPIIAAVNGVAMGGGFEIAMSADFIVAAEHAQFFLPETRVGVLPDAGSIRLPRLMPRQLANEIIFGGRRLTADEAMSWGIVNKVAPVAELMNTARALASEICLSAPLSIAAVLDIIRVTEDLSVADSYAAMRKNEAYMKAINSEDAMEGPNAFAEKRDPVWKGK